MSDIIDKIEHHLQRITHFFDSIEKTYKFINSIELYDIALFSAMIGLLIYMFGGELGGKILWWSIAFYVIIQIIRLA